jgi:Cu/Ag efflux protein CusF
MLTRITFAVASLIFLASITPLSTAAQTPTDMTGSATATMSAKIVGIDKTNRQITLQGSDGSMSTFQATPEIKRFNDLKVGDTVTFTYKQAVATSVVPADAVTPDATGSPTMERGTGAKPSGTISQTQTATVTIQAIDMSKPSITVKTQDGRVLTYLVQNKDNLAKFKVGDNVKITYTEALMIDVK